MNITLSKTTLNENWWEYGIFTGKYLITFRILGLKTAFKMRSLETDFSFREDADIQDCIYWFYLGCPLGFLRFNRDSVNPEKYLKIIESGFITKAEARSRFENDKKTFLEMLDQYNSHHRLESSSVIAGIN